MTTQSRTCLPRLEAGFEVVDRGARMDVLWMRVSQRPGDPKRALGTLGGGHFLIMIDRGTYRQCSYIIPKGSFDSLKGSGIERLQKQLACVEPDAVPRLLEAPRNAVVVDFGTSTGVYAIEIAEQRPDARIFALDGGADRDRRD